MGPPLAQAAPCPDVDVVFARGTDEPPGVGVVGQTFVDAFRADVAGAKTVDVYPVNYPASRDYATGVDGVIDAGNHVRDVGASCPETEIVLGGYSQGAGVIALLTSDGTAAGSPALPNLPGPLPPGVADQVAAVALFGKPSNELVDSLGMPPLTVGPLYAAKTIDLCVDGDPICSTDLNNSIVPHLLYGVNGMAAQAARFAAGRL
ncbi:MAG: cutinase family protein [Actinomycetota bacterium]|nr:cutinase family protein [Actinomycetota bacterium]MDA2948324.1 cutinase family protein [Actinomycetota bacterium]